MRLFRGINIGFRIWPLAATGIFVAGIIASTHGFADNLSAQPQEASAPCPTFGPASKILPRYKDLKSVNIDIEFPPSLRWALECQGHEEDCARRGIIPTSAARSTLALSQWATKFKLSTSNYPQSLYPIKLSNAVLPFVKKSFAPALPRDSSCRTPEPTVISPQTRAEHIATLESPDVLNLIITITLVQTTNPHTVVLTFRESRAGKTPSWSPFLTTAIPLSMSPDEINKAVDYFVTNDIAHSFNVFASGEE